MIKVDTKELSERLKLLDKSINDYDFYTGSIYHELSNVSDNWNDDRKTRLFAYIDKEKKNNQRLVSNMREHYKLYQRVCSSYSELGKKIECNVDSKGYILEKMDNIIESMGFIVNLFDNLGDVSFYPYARNLYDYRRCLNDKLTLLQQLRKELKEKYEKIEGIENSIPGSIAQNNVVKIDLNMEIGRI